MPSLPRYQSEAMSRSNSLRAYIYSNYFCNLSCYTFQCQKHAKIRKKQPKPSLSATKYGNFLPQGFHFACNPSILQPLETQQLFAKEFGSTHIG